MDEPWRIYHEEVLRRTGRSAHLLWNRDEDFREAAHRAYEVTVDRLVGHHEFVEEQAVELGKAFGRAVKVWLEQGSFDLDDLARKLEARQAAWEKREFSSF